MDDGQFLALVHRIEHGAHIKLFDIPVDARLHHFGSPLVGADHTHQIETAAQTGAAHFGDADAEVLRNRRTDRNPTLGDLVGVDRDEVHVHERRLAGFVEARGRRHRVMPVQHLAAGLCINPVGCGGSCDGRVSSRHGRRRALMAHAQLISGHTNQSGQRE